MKLLTALTNQELRQAVGYQAELRHSQPAFALTRFGAVHLAIHPCSKPQDILAKANKAPLFTVNRMFYWMKNRAHL